MRINLFEKKLCQNCKAQEMPFNWIFAVFVGGVIIFLALFATSRFINLQRYQVDTELATQLSLLMNPLETTVASATSVKLEMPKETRLQLSCRFTGIGREELRISTKSTLAEEWQEYSAATSINNKYIFAQSLEEGRKLYLFSKTFSMPFKIADLIYLATKDFCFVNPPEAISFELNELEMGNVQVVYKQKDCKSGSKTVCFGSSACEINVYGQCTGFDCGRLGVYDYGLVENREQGEGDVEILYYINPELLYAAVFSSPELYRCNLHRLMYRINMLSRLYIEKTALLKTRGCNTGELDSKLYDLALQASYLAKSDNPIQIKDVSRLVEEANSGLICKVF